ncbi:TetR family transcriptional regulator [Saccharothrix carnea]|uniref:TetR family transcriptional regulator n=1 Tax=Saccharothrix carnea TaxID=1280637 RepID=A0A2P8HEI0_SACCR|nr:TetR/AcrR family transcriptional regulator [Saccharothrix carnea]PSL44604.1 TetR family transcriptional regulator [Saccharothrix carnea]
MTPRTDPRVARSRATVLRATLDLVAERGIPATTVEAVAERSGVAKTTIYRQWPDRAALVLDAFDTTLDPPTDPDTGTLRDDLVHLLTGLAHALTTGPAAALMPALVDAAQRDPVFAALHRREADRRHRVVLDAITRGIARGELPADTDPADVLDLLAGPLFHRRLISAPELTTDFAHRVVDLVLRAHTTPAPGRPEGQVRPWPIGRGNTVRDADAPRT